MDLSQKACFLCCQPVNNTNLYLVLFIYIIYIASKLYPYRQLDSEVFRKTIYYTIDSISTKPRTHLTTKPRPIGPI